ncbi:Rab escort protein 1 [Bienertia sinuspersici]
MEEEKMPDPSTMVEPTKFDLIIVGTGLPQSIIAAAASTVGKTVLHLDPNPFYGLHFSSLSPPDLSSFLTSQEDDANVIDDAISPTHGVENDVDYGVVSLSSHNLYSNVDISSHNFSPSSRFWLDVSGPRVLFSADSCIDLFLKSGVHHYLDFKPVDLCLIYDSHSHQFFTVPDSRNAIFKDHSLSLTDKLCLNKFFKLVQLHLSGDGDSGNVISPEDLESPFVLFLEKNKLPLKTKWFILYAIALADYDQEDLQASKHLLSTKDGIDRMAMYHSSIGRFPNAPGAMLYPMYGQGELPQAFCRRAAVKGSIYVLRMPVTTLLADKGSGLYRGVRLASGQDLFSQKLLIDPQYLVPQALASSRPDVLRGSCQNSCPRDMKKVARGICISTTSLKPDASNLLIVIPPR